MTRISARKAQQESFFSTYRYFSNFLYKRRTTTDVLQNELGKYMLPEFI